MASVIDFDGPVPVYRQLADALRARTESGEIPPGRAIPSKRRVHEEYGTGGHTYDRAVAVLRDEGVVEGVQGMGTFVKRR